MRPAHSPARLLLKIVAAAAALVVLYLVIANGVLAAKLRSLARDPRVEVRHGMAYTLYPGRIHVEDLQISGREGRDFRLSMERADLRADVLQLLRGRLRITGLDSVVSAIEIGGHRLTGSMRARAEGLRTDSSAVSVGSASLAIAGGEVRRLGGQAAAPVSGALDVRSATLPDEGDVELAGAVHLAGSDAGALLDVAGTPPAARWALEGLDGQAFTIDAEITRRGDVVALDAVRLDSAGIEVRGALHRRGDARRGAFLVRRGRFTTGIALEGDRADVVLAPDEGWLSRQLDTMAGH